MKLFGYVFLTKKRYDEELQNTFFKGFKSGYKNGMKGNRVVLYLGKPIEIINAIKE